MNDAVRERAIEAAARAHYELNITQRLGDWTPRPWGRLDQSMRDEYLAVADISLAALEDSLLADGHKVTPREATDGMVRAEAENMCLPLNYLKMRWAAIWDAGPVGGEDG